MFLNGGQKKGKAMKNYVFTITILLMIISIPVMAAEKIWIGSSAVVGYDSGSDEPTVGDELEGTTSGATATFVSATVASGSWAGNDAAGVLTLRAVGGTFVEDEILINNSTLDTDVATIDIAGTAFTDGAGDFNIASNWSPSGAPADGDELIFNGIADTVPTGWAGSSNQTPGKKFSVDGTLDQSAKNFLEIIVSDAYTGNIGQGLSGSTYAALRCASDGVIFAGTGEMHLVAQHASLPIDSVASGSNNGNLFLGKGFTNGQEITEVVNSNNGDIQILTATLSTLAAPEIDIVVCSGRSGQVTIPDDNSSTVLAITAVLGTVTAYCNIDSLLVSGGTVEYGLDDVTPSAAKAIDLLVLAQGSFIWDMAGTVSEAKCYDGTFSLTGSGAKVIGDSTLNNGTIEIYGSTVDFSEAANNISLATDAEIKIIGDGTFIPPKFVDVTWD